MNKSTIQERTFSRPVNSKKSAIAAGRLKKEAPKSGGLTAFSDWLDEELGHFEDQFREYQTSNSILKTLRS